MIINRKGVTRIVIEFKRVVVKIPNFTCQWSHFLKGIVGNINENKTWKYNSGNFEKGTSYLLCPVLWCSWGGWILVMKKAIPLQRSEWDTTYIPEHKKYFKGDDTISNYGWLDGRLVKFDYADLESWPSDFKPEYNP
jgi:hypothetical protein